MKDKVNLDTIQPADRLVLPKIGLNLVQHHAIYLGKDLSGNRTYIENSIENGVQQVSEEYLFRDGYEFTRIERFQGNPQERNDAIKYAIQLIGKQYNLLNFNCEHYANLVQHRKCYSKQVEVYLCLFVLFVGVKLFIK